MKPASSAWIAAVLALAVVGAAGCGGPLGGDPDDFAEVPGVGSTRIDVPRPTGLASAPCDEDPLPPATGETTVERVAALRDIGLFADRAGVSDVDLAAEVDERIAALWGSDLSLDDPFRDLAVAEQDSARVLWIDLEADVSEDNQIYVATLDQLEAISAGAFAPVGAAESWDSGSGPVTVSFDLDGARHELTPAYFEDWIDPGILVAVNALIADSGRRFELYRAFDQTALVLALTDAERTALEDRGWCFE